LLRRELNATRFLPTQSRRGKKSIWLNYGGGNNPWKAGKEEATQVIFNGSVRGFRWQSSLGNGSDGGGVGQVSSSRR
jgi:hypothetical protein